MRYLYRPVWAIPLAQEAAVAVLMVRNMGPALGISSQNICRTAFYYWTARPQPQGACLTFGTIYGSNGHFAPQRPLPKVNWIRAGMREGSSGR